MSSGFVTEKELEEKRKVRQEEWDRVRKPEDPLEAPLPAEQLPDRRSLYERLQEQKNKKQDEFDEAHKLKNLVRGLDDDEAEFLDYVDHQRIQDERRKRMEEAKELDDFRSKAAEFREKILDDHIKQEIGLIKPDKKQVVVVDEPSIGIRKTPQSKLLAGLVKRKSSGGESSTEVTAEKKPRCESESSNAEKTEASSKVDNTAEIPSVPFKGGLVCIGVLPGLGCYTESDSDGDDDNDDSNSSNSDSERVSPLRDLCGRLMGEVDEDKGSCKDKKKQ